MTTAAFGVRARLLGAVALVPLCASLSVVPAFAQSSETAGDTTLAPVVVEGQSVPVPATTTYAPAQSTASPAADGGDYLRSLPGVSGGRIGGHAMEIFIRGQSQDRIAVMEDGTYTFGGCPNRMDAPTSTVPIDTVDTVTVQRGYQSVLNGPPAPAGTVEFERVAPEFTSFGVTGSAGAGYDANAVLRYGYTDITAGMAEGYVRGSARAKAGENYTDGGGDKVRSAFRQYGAGIEVGWRPDRASLLSLSLDRDEVKDALFAGTSMDAPSSVSDSMRLAFERDLEQTGPLVRVEAMAYGSFVEHTMDNFTLRPAGMMKRRNDAKSDTWGGRAAAELALGETRLTLGVDHRTNNRDSLLSSPTANLAFMIPDVVIADTGLFAEANTALTDRLTLTAGARVDRVTTEADKAGLKAPGGMMTAQQLYAQTYGVTDVEADETNVSGVLRLQRDFGGFDGWIGVSRAVRTADGVERGIAKPGGASAWVGNPQIDPEKHHQIDIGVSASRATWAAGVTGWADYVEDYISRDTARGQDGILVSDGRAIYRNVDARLAGVELQGELRLLQALRVSADATYTWGENTTDDRALYQIPPLSGALEVAWEPGGWSVGSRFRWALKQGRVDDDPTTGSGLDPRKTPGYGIVDLFASWHPLASLELRAGVTNLFDDAYTSHLSRADLFEPKLVQVNEPGRSFYVQGKVTF